MLVSPWIAPRTIVRAQLEHSSVVGTVRKLFGATSSPLGRDATAGTFDFDTIPHLDTPRTDHVRFPHRVASVPNAPNSLDTTAGTRATELARLMVRQTHRSLQRIGLRPVIDAEGVVNDQQASDFMRAAIRMIAEGGTNAPV